MKSWIKSFVIMLVSLFLVLGCQDVADELVGKKPEGARTINITMIAKSSDNPVFLSAKIGAETAAKDLSEKYSMLDVNILWSTPLTENAEEQAEIISNAVKVGTDAIIVSCSDDSILTQAINEAVDNGITLMTFDSDAPNSKRFAFYGPNDVEIGENVMNELSKLIGGEGEVAILGGSQSAPNIQKRVKGAKKAAENFNKIRIVGEFYHPENAKDAAAEVLRVNSQYPNLKGWAMVGGWPFFNDELMNKIESSKIKIVAVDALPVQLPYIENGIVSAFFGQPTFKWGTVCVEKIVDKLHHNKNVEEINEMKLIKVNKDNLGGWSRQLRAWGYNGIPDKYLIM
ncbi:MAG: substrate-binding domain-containing protein [Melioribacteraceae bacterium]|nr:substrate-binding domain-containing protein [Melioribacteraceae bacterium]